MSVAIASIMFGTLIILGRVGLVLAPATTLRAYQWLLGTATRTRRLGLALLALAVAMFGACINQGSVLAGVLLLCATAMLLASVMLLLFTRLGMDLAGELLPDTTQTDLYGWRLLGLIGVVVGWLFCFYGWQAL